jgi:hypothetical protein
MTALHAGVEDSRPHDFSWVPQTRGECNVHLI